MRIVSLGASGNAGRQIAVLLAPLLTAADELVLAGRDARRLEGTRDALSGSARVGICRVDVTDEAAVRDLVAGSDLVVMTVSRPDLVGRLAQIVMDAGSDWIDTLLSSRVKLAALRELEPHIERAGRCFVTDGGFHPGLPAALVRWAAGQLDAIVEADVFAGLRDDWRADTLAQSTFDELLTEFTDFEQVAWADGRLRKLGWKDYPAVDFGPPIGRKRCAVMGLAEMRDLPQQFPGLQRCAFYIGGFGPAMDYLALPAIMAMAKVAALRSTAVRLTRWSLANWASHPPPHRLVLRLAATGMRDGAPAVAAVTVSGGDGYVLTAAPVVTCIQRILDGSVRPPGLHLQAHLLPTEHFLGDLALLGLTVETKVDTKHGRESATN